MSEIEIRMAQPDELEVASEFWTKLNDFHRARGFQFPVAENAGSTWAQSFERTLGRYSFIWLVLDAGVPRGMLAARVKRTPEYLGGVMVAEISDLYVDEPIRGQGVASKLLEAAQKHLATMDIHSFEVQVLAENPEADSFWEQHGYDRELVQFRLKLDD